jgi:hypothetical protein
MTRSYDSVGIGRSVWREPRSFNAVPKPIFYGEQFVYSDVTAKRASRMDRRAFVKFLGGAAASPLAAGA